MYECMCVYELHLIPYAVKNINTFLHFLQNFVDLALQLPWCPHYLKNV